MGLRVFGLLPALAVLMSGPFSARAADVTSADPAKDIAAKTIDTKSPRLDPYLHTPQVFPREICGKMCVETTVQQNDPVGGKDGIVVWNPAHIKLYTVPKYQEGTNTLWGTEIGNYLNPWTQQNGAEPANFEVCEWLLEPKHQHYIPQEWKDQMVMCWGTRYQAQFIGEDAPRVYVEYITCQNSAGTGKEPCLQWGHGMQPINNVDAYRFRWNMPALVLLK